MKAQVTWLGISVNRYSCRAGSKQGRPPAFLRGWLRALRTDTKFMFIGKSTLALTANAVVQSLHGSCEQMSAPDSVGLTRVPILVGSQFEVQDGWRPESPARAQLWLPREEASTQAGARGACH